MGQSIRWRLVLGTMLLTLLTISAVGVVALLLMQRYMVQQERAYLTANAQAIARQAADFMIPVQVAPPLQQLAQTAAFLGDVDVRIVDAANVPLADSSATTPYSFTANIAASSLHFEVAVPAAAPVAVPLSDAPTTVWASSAEEVALMTSREITAASSLTMQETNVQETNVQETNVFVVQRSPSFWGDRLLFAAPAGKEGEAAVRQASLPDPSLVAVDELGAGMESVQEMIASTTLWPAQAVPGSVATWPEMKVSAGHSALLEAAGLQQATVVSAPIQSSDGVVGFVELGRDTGLVDEPLSAVRQALAIAAGASSLLAIAVGLVMSRTVTTPVQTLAQAAAAMSSGDLAARAPVAGRDELAALARQFNQMADALQRSFAELEAERDTLRRFVADASHELRTPVTALRTFNELLQGPAQADHAAQAEFLAESDAQIARLEWITRNLLDLSRWDGGIATLARAEVELGEVVAAAVGPFRKLAQERQLALEVVKPAQPLMAQVDAPRLAMALGNLIDNALKFTPCGGRVEVGVRQEGTRLAIWVADNGMGIAAEDLPYIYQRFYRSPRATQAGSGLGLAIVERIVQAHGARIEVASQEGVGSRFTLWVA